MLKASKGSSSLRKCSMESEQKSLDDSGAHLSSRRGFAQLAGGVALASGLVLSRRAKAVSTRNRTKQTEVALWIAEADELEVGRIVEFEYPESHAAFLVVLEGAAEGGVGKDENIVAFHRACPHMGCPLVSLDSEKAQLGPCGCHRSLFDLRNGGAQIYGMATQRLPQIALEVRGKDLFATGVRGLPYGEALGPEHL